MAEKDSFSFEIKISVGEISKSSKGWTKELNLVSWNGRKADRSGDQAALSRCF
jgi:hypothetical protein